MRAVREFIIRLAGTVRRRRSDADLEDELRSHLAFAEDEARRRGESPRDARLRAGNAASAFDAIHDQRHVAWLDAIRLDTVFAWRQLLRYRMDNAVAIASLAVALGATTAAVRLVDAVLLRPLPVADPSRLVEVTIAYGNPGTGETRDDMLDYPSYRAYAQAIGDRARPLVVGSAARQLVTVRPGDDPEPVFRQFVSGNAFGVLGLQPAAGRLLTPADDDAPGAHPVAVIGHDWWTRRFGADPAAVGRTIWIGGAAFEIVGVAPRGFTGTEPGTITDVFVSATMNFAALNSKGWSWFRLWLRPAPAVTPATLQQVLQAAFPKDDPRVVSAEAGVSPAQKTFRRPLVILAALAAIVLLVACANVANLLTARAVARAREMSLRISIGAGRGRLIQLVLIESLLLGVLASAFGAVLAADFSTVVIGMLAQPDRPLRLVLDSGWRSLGFGAALTLGVTLLFGLLPAMRASAAKPVDTLKGTTAPKGPGAGAWTLIGVQVAFSSFLLIAAALFTTTFGRLLVRPLGFSPDGVLVMSVESRETHDAAFWAGAVKALGQTAGVETAAIAAWAPLSGNRWHGDIRVNEGPERSAPVNLLDIGPTYFDTLRIAVVAGREFAPGERNVAIVNEALARRFFDGADPIGRQIVHGLGDGGVRRTIVGLVRDAVYSNVREEVPPTVYLPLEPRSGGTFFVRAGGPAPRIAPSLRHAFDKTYPNLRVRAVERLGAFVEQQMVRERLLASLSAFFATAALLIAGLGLYAVLNGAVARQRREIGIRMALGARSADVVARIAASMTTPVLLGAALGVAGGIAFGRAARSLLFEIVPGHPASLVMPALVLTAAVVIAILPPAVRASRIDPAETLRSE